MMTPMIGSLTTDAPPRSAEALEERLGQNIRATRIARDLSQRELADRANVSLGAVRTLETGRGSTVTTLVKVLRALDRQDWVDALVPPSPAFNPLDLLDAPARRPAPPTERRRVGRRRQPGRSG